MQPHCAFAQHGAWSVEQMWHIKPVWLSWSSCYTVVQWLTAARVRLLLMFHVSGRCPEGRVSIRNMPCLGHKKRTMADIDDDSYISAQK